MCIRDSAGSDRVCPERWPHRSLFQVGNTSRQCARTKNHGEVFGLLIGEPAGDNPAIPDRIVDARHLLDLAVKDDCQAVPDVPGGEFVKTLPTLACKREVHRWLTVVIAAGFGGAQIAACYSRGAGNQVPGLAALVSPSRPNTFAFHQNSVGWQQAVMGL